MKEEKEIKEHLIQIFLDQLKTEKRIPEGVDVKLLQKALSKELRKGSNKELQKGLDRENVKLR